MPSNPELISKLLPQEPTPEEQAFAELQQELEGQQNPYATEPGAPEVARNEAVEQFADMERNLINHTEVQPQTDVLSTVKEAEQKNGMLLDAREKLGEIFGDTAVEEATKKAVEDSRLETKNAPEVADALAHDKQLASTESSVDIKARDVGDEEKAQAGYAELKDKVGENSDKFTGRIAKRARLAMKKLGINGKREEDLKAEEVEAVGAKITQDKTAKDVESGLVGESLVASLVDNKPGMRSSARKDLLEKIKDDPTAVKRLGNSIRHYRSGGRKLSEFKKLGETLTKIN